MGLCEKARPAMQCTLCGHGCRETVKDFGQNSFSLAVCRHCGGTCDKYVEFELTLVVFDLVLHRISAYRHVLFNRLKCEPFGLQGTVLGMLAGMIAVDALRGTHLDLGAILDNRSDPAAPVLDGQDIVKSLATFFLRAALEFALYNAAIVLFVCMYLYAAGQKLSLSLTYVTVVLGVSSFGKYLYLLTIVWPYTAEALHGIDLFVLTSNVVALQAFLNCRVGVSAAIVLLATAFCHIAVHLGQM